MTESTDNTRLNKHLALQLGISRREADDLIATGKVTIDDKVATLGARIEPTSNIAISGKPVVGGIAFEYIALHKPVGYVCSRKPQGDSPTIYSIIPKQYHHLKPVGRLDKDSSGVILLSNDGDFAFRMTHPKFAKQKRYEVQLDHNLEPLHHQMIVDYGVQLPDGVSKLSLEKLKDVDSKAWIVTMGEGRNRQIRRTFGALGYTVTALHRTNFGDYSLGDIEPGEFEIVNMR